MKAKRSNTLNSNTDTISTILWNRVQEGGFILLSALAIFLLVALFTYNQADPGWSHTNNSQEIQNTAGKAGAWFADLCLYLFGYIAYMFPALIAYGSFQLFQSRVKSGYFHRLLWVLRAIGFIAAVISGCGIASLHFSVWAQGMPVSAGGACGQFIGAELAPALGYWGSTLALTATFLAGITLTTGLSWFGLMDVLTTELWEKSCQWWVAFPSKWQKLQQSYRTFSIKTTLKEFTNTIFSWRKKDLANMPLALGVKKEPTLGLNKRLAPTFNSPQAQVLAPVNRPTARVAPLFSLSDSQEDQTSIPAHSRAIPPKASTKIIPSIPMSGPNSLPSVELLEQAEIINSSEKFSANKLEELSREVEARLLEFGVQVSVVAVYPGPVITRFELELAAGLKVSKISGLAKDLARALSVTRVRVVEVIPGKSVVGLEIPNEYRELVRFREIIESEAYQESQSPLSLALGKDIAGEPVVVNLAKMPHLLVAGTTGSGKSVGINVMLLSLLYKATPLDVRLILIDPKMLELSIYDGIPHLLTPVVTDMKDAANALRWCVGEMERRYQLMSALGVRNVIGFNRKIFEAEEAGQPVLDPLWRPEFGTQQEPLQRLPYIVVIIDEFADMIMVVGKKVEELIARIAQKARAAGIHLILATQRPSVDVITGLIKANVPTRIAYQVSSRIDSRTILDQQGAEQLLGHGDMLYLAPGTGVPERIHGAFVSDEEVHAVVKALKQFGTPNYEIDVLGSGTGAAAYGSAYAGYDDEQSGEQDELYDAAVQIVSETRRASISHLQRRLKIGYNRAARLIETMEAAGIVSNMQHNGGREVLVRDPGQE